MNDTPNHTRRELADLAGLLAEACGAGDGDGLTREAFDGITAAYTADPAGFREFALAATGHAGWRADEVPGFRAWVTDELLTPAGTLAVCRLWDLCPDSTDELGNEVPCPVPVDEGDTE